MAVSVDAQDYLRLVEKNNSICFFDIEATGLRGDYNSILCVTVRPYRGRPTTFRVDTVGNDRRVVREAREYMDTFDCWCGYYSKGFDKPMLNTRALRWGDDPLPPKHHIDLFFTLKSHTVMSRKSLAQFAGLLDLHDQKMGVSPNVWTEVLGHPRGQAMRTMVQRCESDTEVLRQMYDKTKYIIKEIKRG